MPAGPIRPRRPDWRNRLLFPLLDFVLPSRCFACDEPLGPLQVEGACAGCWVGLRPIGPRGCPGCGLPVSSHPATNSGCPGCRELPLPWESATAAVLYDRTARRFLARVKLEGRRELLEPIADQLAIAARIQGPLPSRALLVPVPSHRWNDLRRGFSPSRLLARAVARRLGLDCEPLVSRSCRSPAPLKRLDRDSRSWAATRAFRLRNRPETDRPVVLVDDVMTTGASLSACAALLRETGVSRVSVLFWARVPRPDRSIGNGKIP